MTERAGLARRALQLVLGERRRYALSLENVGASFIFVHVPKNAGSAIADALHLETSHHYRALDYRRMLGPLGYRKRFVFAFVRNPWSRFLSLYRYARAPVTRYHSAVDPTSAPHGKHLDYDLLTGASLDQCADHLLSGALQHDRLINHWRPQVDWLTDGRGRIMVDYVGRVETLTHDWARLAERLGLPLPPLAWTNRSRAAPADRYRDAFTPYARDVVASYYRADIDAFGYTF